MGRIVDLRDPDTYMSVSEYAKCVERARKANDEKRKIFQDEMNEKLKPYNIKIKLVSKLINDRTYTNIFLFNKYGERYELGTCYESNGEDIKETTKKLIRLYFNKIID